MHALEEWSPPQLVNVSEDRPQQKNGDVSAAFP
jgi:hypothetical protein